jgi:hypothetical protein
VEQSRAAAATEPDAARRVEPKFVAQDLDEFRRRLLLVVERELPKRLPVVRDLEWKRRWNPSLKTKKTRKKFYREVASWREAPGSPKAWLEPLLEDWPKKLLAPLVWLGTQTLERTAPQDRRRMAEEFIRSIGARAELAKISVPQKSERWWVKFSQSCGKPSSSSHPAVTAQIYRPHGFLEQELARLLSRVFPRDLRSSWEQLLLLCRLHQTWLEKQLAKQLQAAIRRIGRKEAEAHAARISASEASGATIAAPIPEARPAAATSHSRRSSIAVKSQRRYDPRRGAAAERFNSRAATRRAVVEPILLEKGWSVLEWASESEVDHHTADDYLSGATKPYKSTRKKLAASLGLTVESLPD